MKMSWHRDDFLLHAYDLGDRGHLARTVTQAVQLADQVLYRSHLLAMARTGRVDAGIQDERLERANASRVVWREGSSWNRRGRCSWPAACRGPLRRGTRRRRCARAHAEGVDDKPLDGDLAFAVDVFRSGLEATNVLLVELQLGRVSMVTNAVLDGMKPDSTLRNVVLPVPVPPDTTMFAFAKTAALRKPKPACCSCRTG